MRRALWLVCLGGVVLIAAGVHADEDVHEVRVIAHDDASNCVQETAPCFEIPNAGWGLVEDDDEVDITFENNASQAHSLLIAAGEDADPENGTPSASAFLELGPIEPGASATMRSAIPGEPDTVHLFCGVGDHEEQGMHLTRNVFPGGSVAEGENQTIGPPEGTPLEGWVALAGLGAASYIARRQR